MLGIEDRNLGSVIDDLKRGFDLVRITVVDVIRIHLNIVAEVCNDLIDQRSNVGLVLAEIRLFEKFVLLQEHIVVNASVFAVFHVIFPVELYGNDCRDQHGNGQYNDNEGLHEDPFLTVFAICRAALLFFFRHFSKPPFFKFYLLLSSSSLSHRVGNPT